MSQVEQSTEIATTSKRQSVIIFWVSLAVIIALALGAGIWWVVGNLPLASDLGSSESFLSAEDIPALYQEFECPCCGMDIGSCTCGMALERQSAVNALVARGSTSSQLHLAMYSLYGEAIFFDQELTAQVQAELEASLPADRPILVVDPAQIDLGSTPIDGGPVSATYELRNSGETNLVITGLLTSCACTIAVLESDEGTSPIFGATAPENAEEWSAIVPPGGQVLVVATYDPLFHGDSGIGSFTRAVSVLSNDPLNARFDLVFKVEVTE